MGFIFRVLLNEVKSRILPNLKDVVTALAVTLVFGLYHGWDVQEYAVFFVIALVIVYLVSRLVHIIHVLIGFNRMKKKMGGIVNSMDALKGFLKR